MFFNTLDVKDLLPTCHSGKILLSKVKMKTSQVKKTQRLKEEIRKLKSFLAFLNLRQEERKRRLNEVRDT